MRIFLSIFLFLLIPRSFAETDAEPYGIPPGFSWKQMPCIRAFFLFPDNWFFTFTVKDKDGYYSYFITKENITKNGFYETGLSIRVFRGISEKTGGMTPSGYAAKALLDAEKAVNIRKKWQSDKGIFKEFGIIWTSNTSGKKNITIHKIYIANDKTGTLYMIVFEGPTAQWDELWKTGGILLENFTIDEKI